MASQFDQFMEFFILFLQENIIAVMVLGLLGLYAAWWFVRNQLMMERGISRAKHDWKAIKKTGQKITDQMIITVNLLGGSGFIIKNDIYLIDSQQEKSLFRNSQGETREVIKKTDTYVSLQRTRHGGEVAAFKITDLEVNQNLLSGIPPQKMMNIDPSIAMGQMKFLLAFSFLFEAMLMYCMFAEIEIDFLIDPRVYPWYVVLLTAWLAKYLVDTNKIGYAYIAYGQELPQESFKLGSMSEVLTVSVHVFLLKEYHHPAIRVENVLDVDTDHLIERINKENAKRVTSLSAKVASLLSQVNFLTTVINQKDEQLDTMHGQLEQRFNDGLLLGLTEERPLSPDYDQLPAGHGMDFFTFFDRSKWFFGFLITAALVVIAGWWLMNNASFPDVQLDFTTLLMYAGILLVILLVAGMIISRIYPKQ
ncbi:MAG: hypothetical protein ACFFD4_02535 [Candidatus Odinarchaeota archaeon]